MIDITDFLMAGEENAVTSKYLAKLLDTSTRQITLIINYERCNGKVILSSDKGYFLPSHPEEVKHFVNTMNSRCKEIQKASQSAKDFLNGGME